MDTDSILFIMVKIQWLINILYVDKWTGGQHILKTLPARMQGFIKQLSICLLVIYFKISHGVDFIAIVLIYSQSAQSYASYLLADSLKSGSGQQHAQTSDGHRKGSTIPLLQYLDGACRSATSARWCQSANAHRSSLGCNLQLAIRQKKCLTFGQALGMEIQLGQCDQLSQYDQFTSRSYLAIRNA